MRSFVMGYSCCYSLVYNDRGPSFYFCKFNFVCTNVFIRPIELIRLGLILIRSIKGVRRQG